MQLQLYALPGSGRSEGGLSFEHRTGGSSDTLTCLLQASGIPQGQRIEVRVNDTLQQWQEGSNQSFSWEMQEYTDEIHLHLRTDAVIIASWRGLWKGSAIFHLGTLPVRVFFNGVEQTLAEVSTVIQLFDPSRDPFPRNGHEEIRILPSEPDPIAKLSAVEIVEERLSRETEAGETEARHEEAMSQDEEVPGRDEEEEQYDEEMDEDDEYRDEEEEEDDMYDDQEEEMTEGVFVVEQDQLVLTEEQRREPATLEEGMAIVHGEEEELAHHEDAMVPVVSTAERMEISSPQQIEPSEHGEDTLANVAIGNVAVFHADPTDRKQTLERLKELLSTMPKKTVIIDLRELPRARQKEEYHPLSRVHLRAVFGGCYWDRSQYLKTTPHSVPDPQRPMGRRWERIVSDVNDPEGLPFLEKYVREGYSMILMDSIGRDEESARRAVVIALQERIPTLKDMSHLHSNE